MNGLRWAAWSLFGVGVVVACLGKQWASIPWIITAAIYYELNRRRTYGHRKDSQDDSGRAGAVPARPSGERPRGAEPEANSGPGAVASEIIGWRAWTIKDGKLVSPVKDIVWEGPTLRTDALPNDRNTSGIYALEKREALGHYATNGAYGEVALTGRVVCGEKGYRAEVATIRSLYVVTSIAESGGDGISPPGTWGVTPSPEIVAALAERYQVTVIPVPPAPPEFMVGLFGVHFSPEYYTYQCAQRDKYAALAPQPEPENPET